MASIAFAAAGSAKAEYITNGDFATGSFSGWTLSNLNSYSMVNTDSGILAAELTTSPDTGDETLSQNLQNLIIGQSYQLSFQVTSGTGQPDSFSASVAGITLLPPTDIPYNDFSYTTYTYNFTASTATDSLSFGYRDDADYVYLANVTVTVNSSAVPEPSTILMVSLGLLASVAYSSRKHLDPRKLRFAHVPE